MPRLMLAVGMAGIVLGAGAAHGGQPAPRDAQAGYTAAGGAAGVGTFSAGGQGSTVGAATLPTRVTERSVTLTIADDSGQPVAAHVVQVLDEQTGEYVAIGDLCGPAPRAFRLKSPGSPVSVRPVAGTCDGALSAPVSGVVTARFHQR